MLLSMLESVLDPLSPWTPLLASLHGRVTYCWWTETNSGRDGYWLTASLGHNLDRDGNVALLTTYKYGTHELTGKKTDVVKVELSFKTCADLTSVTACRAGDAE